MARITRSKRTNRNKRTDRYSNVKGRQNARRKPILPKRGVDQTSYESGFFDFLNVFWKNSGRMNLYKLTKEAANVWEALLPQPKLSKRQIFKDYYREYEALMKEENRKRNLNGLEQENLERDRQKRENRRKMRRHVEDSDEEVSRDDFDEDTESDLKEERSRSDIEDKERSNNEEDNKELEERGYSTSGSESNEQNKQKRQKQRTTKNKRKYRNYAAYVKAKKSQTQNKPDKGDKKDNETENSKNNGESVPNETKTSGEPNSRAGEDSLFFPIREKTSLDRLVEADLDNQTEILKKLKICKPHSDIPYDSELLDEDSLDNVESDDSFVPINDAGFPIVPQPSLFAPNFQAPSTILYVKNLILGIRQPELQEIFRVYLNDIVSIRVIDSKLRGEAIVEFKSIEAAENVWKQMNGVEYKRLPMVLEFIDKEDIVN